MADCISIQAISKTFSQVKALNDVSLNIPEHCIYGIIGPNGAGKTTLFSIIAGFLKPDSGTVRVLGHDSLDSIRGQMSILPQDARFQASVSVVDQLVFFLQVSGWTHNDAWNEVERVLDLVDFSELLGRNSATLSHGQYKRLCLAQAFLGKPKLVILDEPCTGLDLASAKTIRSYIRKLKADTSVIISSHDMDEMQDLCDEVTMLSAGKIGSSGKVLDISRAQRSMTLVLTRALEASERAQLNAVLGIKSVQDQESLGSYALSFDAEDDEHYNQAKQALMTLLIKLNLSVRSMAEDNALEALYLSSTEASKAAKKL